MQNQEDSLQDYYRSPGRRDGGLGQGETERYSGVDRKLSIDNDNDGDDDGDGVRQSDGDGGGGDSDHDNHDRSM